MTEMTQTTVTEEQLDATIEHFKTLGRGALLMYVTAIGTYLLNQYFGGSFAKLKSHDPRKLQSFRDLVTRRREELAEIGLSSTTLRRYLKVTEVWHDLPAEVRNELDLPRLFSLTTVKKAEDRRSIALQAVSCGWRTGRIKAAVAEHKLALRRGKHKPGPKPQLEALKAAAAVVTAVRRLVELGPSPDVLYEPKCRQLEDALWTASEELRFYLQRQVSEHDRATSTPDPDPMEHFAKGLDQSLSDAERHGRWVLAPEVPQGDEVSAILDFI